MLSLLLLGAAAGTLTAQVVTVVLAFFIVTGLLTYFLWKPMIGLIDERREKIESEFVTIERKQAELDSRLKDYEERLRQIDTEARDRMNKAIEEGRRTAQQMVEDARRQTEEMKAKANADIRLEIDKARVALREEMVSLTIGATEKLLRQRLNDDTQRQLVGSFISELESR